MRAKTEVILERYPYRFVQKGLLEENGAPDFRIQKFNDIQKRYYDMYYLDSQAQLDCCLLYTSPSPRDLKLSRMPSSA